MTDTVTTHVTTESASFDPYAEAVRAILAADGAPIERASAHLQEAHVYATLALACEMRELRAELAQGRGRAVAERPPVPDVTVWADRLVAGQKLRTGSPYLHGEEGPTRNQIAAVLHALADHTAIVHMLEVAPALGADREQLGEGWVLAMGVGRYLQALGNAVEQPDANDVEGDTGDPGAPFAWPANGAEFAARYNAMTVAERDAWVQKSVADAQLAEVCVVEGHRERIAELEQKEAARLRDVEHPEYTPENVLDAAYASQAEWWKPGDDAHFPTLQFERAGGDTLRMPPRRVVAIADLIESVADATYKATVTEYGIRTEQKGEGE